MLWAIELEIGFAMWRKLIGAPDTEWDRKRWIKMCHRLGSYKAWDIVERQRKRTHPLGDGSG
jgi:hypothetical protein